MVLKPSIPLQTREAWQKKALSKLKRASLKIWRKMRSLWWRDLGIRRTWRAFNRRVINRMLWTAGGNPGITAGRLCGWLSLFLHSKKFNTCKVLFWKKFPILGAENTEKSCALPTLKWVRPASDQDRISILHSHRFPMTSPHRYLFWQIGKVRSICRGSLLLRMTACSC